MFLVETWLNENVHKDKGWTHDSINVILKAPVGKEKQLIFCYAGSQKGWNKALPLFYELKKTGYYHEEMYHTVFENWFLIL